MPSPDTLGGFQQLVMLAVLRLGDGAYGAAIQDELERRAGRTVAIATVYVTLARLEQRGLVESWLADPTPVRGGRAKRLYLVTAEGRERLDGARAELERMWEGIEASPRTGSS